MQLAVSGEIQLKATLEMHAWFRLPLKGKKWEQLIPALRTSLPLYPSPRFLGGRK